jgi:hypothetical protein
MKEPENDEGVTALADALALSHSAMDQIDAPWARLVQSTLSAALDAVLNMHEAESLSKKIIELQDALINRAVRDRDHWKANHEAQRDMLETTRTEQDMLRITLHVPLEPHQSMFERMLDAARARSRTNEQQA